MTVDPHTGLDAHAAARLDGRLLGWLGGHDAVRQGLAVHPTIADAVRVSVQLAAAATAADRARLAIHGLAGADDEPLLFGAVTRDALRAVAGDPAVQHVSPVVRAYPR